MYLHKDHVCCVYFLIFFKTQITVLPYSETIIYGSIALDFTSQTNANGLVDILFMVFSHPL